MSELVAFMTASDQEEARRIAGHLVERRLAACCNIVGGVESIYRWQGQVESAREILVIIKTTSARIDELKEAIAELHSYDVPELIALPIADGLSPYLEWLRRSTDPESAGEA